MKTKRKKAPLGQKMWQGMSAGCNGKLLTMHLHSARPHFDSKPALFVDLSNPEAVVEAMAEAAWDGAEDHRAASVAAFPNGAPATRSHYIARAVLLRINPAALGHTTPARKVAGKEGR